MVKLENKIQDLSIKQIKHRIKDLEHRMRQKQKDQDRRLEKKLVGPDSEKQDREEEEIEHVYQEKTGRVYHERTAGRSAESWRTRRDEVDEGKESAAD